MKRISILCSLLCMFAFTQCAKDEPVSELIAQEEDSYENLEKVETLWEEGCGKSLDEMAELIKQFQEEFENPSKTRLLVRNNLQDFAVIRIGTSCGNYPTIKLRWDCEDKNPTTNIKTPMINGNSGWANNGVRTDGSALLWHFCLVPNLGFPTYAIKGWNPWGVLLVDPEAVDDFRSDYPNNIIIQRYLDCEDSGTNNYAEYAEPYSTTFTRFDFSGSSKARPDLAAKVGVAFRFSDNVWLTFLSFKDMKPKVQTDHFPNLGFSYAVFGTSQLHSDPMLSAEVYSDDEDKNNTNGWNSDGWYNFDTSNRYDLDYGFVKGGGNTTFYVKGVDPNKIIYND